MDTGIEVAVIDPWRDWFVLTIPTMPSRLTAAMVGV
jgi:hypothetical protein